MHAVQSVATPFSSNDWADGEGNCEEHFERLKTVEKEVIGTIKINSIFFILHILPLAYLGNFFFPFTKYVSYISCVKLQHSINMFIGRNYNRLRNRISKM